jgi:hypothetical protein
MRFESFVVSSHIFNAKHSSRSIHVHTKELLFNTWSVRTPSKALSSHFIRHQTPLLEAVPAIWVTIGVIRRP